MEITEVRKNYTRAEKEVEQIPKKQESTDKGYKNTKEYSDYLNSKY